ncbi:hypothetical protein Cgig2_007473 [Carnegiea gigantea]|uniref:Uncharacterized protein n=1 Tax=Carnegiea gigantea TaxID=171969 RepID=A0A9Q1K6X9_9CARY|nr:hypothetical protein Cgig2_007473 [Carnegiea gigantea]
MYKGHVAHIYKITRQRHSMPRDKERLHSEEFNMIKEKLGQLLGDKEVTTGNVTWEGDVYSQERRGRVHGLGLGPSSFASLSSTQCGEQLDDVHDQCSEKMEFLEAENKRLLDKVKRLESQQTERLAKLARLRALDDDIMTYDVTPSTTIGT